MPGTGCTTSGSTTSSPSCGRSCEHACSHPLDRQDTHMLLQGKRVIVTGGASGIGRATVLACAREGASVVSLSTAAPERSRVRALMAEVEALGAGRMTHLQVDVSDKDAVDRGFDEAAAW